MTDLCGLGNRKPSATPGSQKLADFGFADGVVNFGRHGVILVKDSCRVKQQITRAFSHAEWVPDQLSESISEVVAENLRLLMAQAKLSQPALASRAGVSQKTVSNYLNPQQRVSSATGKAPSPKLEELNQIAAALEVPLWRIVRKWSERELRFYERMEKLWAEMADEQRAD